MTAGTVGAPVLRRELIVMRIIIAMAQRARSIWYRDGVRVLTQIRIVVAGETRRGEMGTREFKIRLAVVPVGVVGAGKPTRLRMAVRAVRTSLFLEVAVVVVNVAGRAIINNGVWKRLTDRLLRIRNPDFGGTRRLGSMA